ncbi:hypothetical protein GGD82_000909 [Roseospira marina]|nr:hypothetical protein [Roseospira marina]
MVTANAPSRSARLRARAASVAGSPVWMPAGGWAASWAANGAGIGGTTGSGRTAIKHPFPSNGSGVGQRGRLRCATPWECVR